MNLKQKVSLGLSGIIIIIMLITTIILSILITKQNKNVSHDLILNSFNLVEEIIQDNKDALSLNILQLATNANMGERIRFLSENREILGYLTVREMYEGVVKSVYNAGIVAGIWKAAVYDANSDLICFADFSDTGTRLGYVHMLPELMCKVSVTEKDKDISFFPEIWTTAEAPPPDFEMRSQSVVVSQLQIQFEIIDGFLCLAAYTPVMADTYDVDIGSVKQKKWGFIKVVKRFDALFIKNMTRLTGTTLNIYLQKRFNVGNMDKYSTLDLENTSGSVYTRRKQEIRLNEISIDSRGYFQGVLSIPINRKPLASLVVLHSKQMVQENTSQIIQTLIMVTLVVMAAFLPLAISLVSRFFITPIIDFTRITSKIAKGDLEKKINTGKKDEFGTLAGSFSKMQDSIKKRISDLERAEEKYRNLFEFAPDGICISTPSGEILSFNDAFYKMSRVTSKKVLLEQNVTDFYKNPEVRQKMLDTLLREKAIRNFELDFKPAAGDTWSAYISLRIIQYGDVEAILAIIRDMSEFKQAQTDLFHLRNLLSSIIDSMPSMIIGVDQNFKVTLMNAEAEKFLKIPSKQAVGKKINDLYPLLSDKKDKIEMALIRRLPYKESKILQEIDNDIRFFSTTIYPLVETNQIGAVIRIDDITEQVRLEEIIIQTEKMVSLGGLAAGMAHEINNPLAGVLQNAFVLKNRLIGDLPANHNAARDCHFSMDHLNAYIEKRELLTLLDSISDSGKRAADIVKNMLSFARMETSDFVECRLDELLDSTVELATADYNLKEKYDFKLIGIEREYEKDLPYIRCSKTKIQQAFFNILQNGAQAMALGGTFDGKPPVFVLTVKKEDSHVIVSIRDNGPGMDETICKRVFEPFFTTKPVGMGTGLGMSISYFIITENHKGTLCVQSLPMQGAEFVMTIPINNR